MDALLRPAQRAEISAIADVFLAARRSILHVVPLAHPDADVPRWIGEALFAETSMWVAERGGAIIAMMSLSPGWLEHLYVHPAAHGGGVGSALLMLAKARPEAALGLQLWTFQGNAGARRFYERHGFTAAEFTDGSGNEERTPDVRYVWTPPQSR